MIEEAYGPILERLELFVNDRVKTENIKLLILMGDILYYPGLKEEIRGIFKWATVYDKI